MSAAAIERRLSAAPELFIHIGAGEGELAGLARRSGRAVMVEPDPDRHAELSVRLQDAPGVEVTQAVIAERAGEATFTRASLARFGSTRPVTGAKTLYRGLRPAGEVVLRAATVSDLVGAPSGQGVVVVIDAVSDALTVLDQLEALGLVAPEARIFVKVAEIALHEGGAARADVEAWASARDYALTRLEDEDDPDIWTAWLEPGAGLDGAAAPASAAATGENPASGPDRAELEAQVEALEQKAEDQAKLVRKHREKANRTGKQLDKARAALKSETAARKAAEQSVRELNGQVESLRSELSAARQSEEELKERVLAAEGGIEAERERAAKESSARREAQSALDKAEKALSARRGELEAVRGEVSRLKAQLEDSQAAAQAELEEARSRAESLAEEVETLNRRTHHAERKAEEVRTSLEAEREARSAAEARAREAEKARQSANAELDAVRSDLAIALRTQNMTQADLKDLQARHESLQKDHQGLEELLGKLMDRLYDASDRAKALSWADSVSDQEREPSDGSER